MADDVLRLEGITKSYNIGMPSEVEVLHGIDLELKTGEFVALIGPSGSGKSTLLQIAGLLEKPDGGAVIVGGRDAAGLNDGARTALRRQVIGFKLPGDTIGLSAGEYHALSADAINQVAACWFPKRAFLRFTDDKPALLRRMNEFTNRELHW